MLSPAEVVIGDREVQQAVAEGKGIFTIRSLDKFCGPTAELSEMQITAHAFYYSATCESCGNTITISYRDLRSCFSGSVPDEALIKGSLLCVCAAARSDMALSSVVPFRH